MPSAMTASLPVMRRLSRRRPASLMGLSRVSAADQHDLGHEAEREDERHRHQHEGEADVGLALLGFHGERGLQPMMRVAVTSSLGGVSKVWNGAGDGSSHSR